jgi:hypothetical protein
MKRTLIVLFITSYAIDLTCQVPDYVPLNGLAAWWSFSGNASDESSNDNNGTVSGATLTDDRNGQPNSAYQFDGVNDHIEVPNSSSLNMPSLTMSAWLNCDNAPTEGSDGMMAIISKWYNLLNCGNNSDTYISVLSNYNFSVRLESACSVYPGSTIISGNPVPLDEWVFITYVHDELVGGSVYINGILAGTNPTSGEICTSTNPLLIGCDNDGGAFWRMFSGKLDDIGIWNRALNDEEILGLYYSCPAISVYEINGDISPTAFTNSVYSYPNTTGSSYTWTVTNGVIVSGQGTNEIEVLWAAVGTGSVSVIEENAAGCTGEPVTFDVVIIPTSITEQNNNEYEISPNPCSDYFKIVAPFEITGSKFMVYNATGQCVMEGKISSSTATISTSSLNSGVYFVTLSDDSHTSSEILVVK